MLKQVHLRSYDDADIIEYLATIEKGIQSRKIREALRNQMRLEGFMQKDDSTLPVAPAIAPLPAASAQIDAEQPDPDMMIGRLLGVRASGN